jgi:hypothetical protein
MEIRKIAENRTSIFIKSLYKLSEGVNSEDSELFNELVDIFIKRNSLEYTQKPMTNVCATVGTINNGIYFHPSDVCFSGDYNTEELYTDFFYVMNLYEIN